MMARGNVIVTVVDVGQGQCTFVEIWNSDNTKIEETLLFDCGSDKGSTETTTNLDVIAAKVLTMDVPAFDCIIFSHSDKDHISLTRYLLDKISETTKPEVYSVWYGGSWKNYTKYGFNILDYLVNEDFCFKDNISKTCANYMGYAKSTDSYSAFFWSSSGGADVKVAPIVSNVISDDPDWDEEEELSDQNTAEEKNRVSIVCGLYYAGVCFVICGDATAKTMSAINGLMLGTNLFNDNVMITMPHHGSRATGFAVTSSQKASDESIKVVDTFVSIMKAKTTTISAYEKHHHPSLELINRFIPTAITPILKDPRLKAENSHLVTAYFDQDLFKISGVTLEKGLVYSFNTNSNTFSTRYSNGIDACSYRIGDTVIYAPQGAISSTTVINNFACWVYSTQGNGATLIEGKANLASTAFTTAATTSALAQRDLEQFTSFSDEKSAKQEFESSQVLIRSTQQKKRSVLPISGKNRQTISHFTH